jgi:hypothetical protein
LPLLTFVGFGKVSSRFCSAFFIPGVEHHGAHRRLQLRGLLLYKARDRTGSTAIEKERRSARMRPAFEARKGSDLPPISPPFAKCGGNQPKGRNGQRNRKNLIPGSGEGEEEGDNTENHQRNRRLLLDGPHFRLLTLKRLVTNWTSMFLQRREIVGRLRSPRHGVIAVSRWGMPPAGGGRGWPIKMACG